MKKLTGPAPVRVLVGVLVAPIIGPGPHHVPKPRLTDPFLEYERKRKALEHAYGLPVEPEV